MILRCVLDGLLLPAEVSAERATLVAYDGEEAFCMEALEARFYELVAARREEIVALQRYGYRFLRFASDFVPVES